MTYWYHPKIPGRDIDLDEKRRDPKSGKNIPAGVLMALPSGAEPPDGEWTKYPRIVMAEVFTGPMLREAKARAEADAKAWEAKVIERALKNYGKGD